MLISSFDCCFHVISWNIIIVRVEVESSKFFFMITSSGNTLFTLIFVVNILYWWIWQICYWKYRVYHSGFMIYSIINKQGLVNWAFVSFLDMCSKTEKKRKQTMSNLPDGSGFGDHIQLLQIFECWDRTDYDIGWCKDNNLQVLFIFLHA